MILAEKIVKLRKQCGWSQEELAEKMSVSRQSVSKWESTNSIPDLNKIIMLAEIFDVSIDSLLKDDIELLEPVSANIEPNVTKISLENALMYVSNKMAVSTLITKGVILCLCSVIPLFLVLNTTNIFHFSNAVAAAIGIVGILIFISIAVSFFIRTNQYKEAIAPIENEVFELEYGVGSVIKDKLQKYRSTYNIKLSVGIFLFIMSFVPLVLTSIFWHGYELIMLIMLFGFIAVGIYIVAPVAAKYDAYNNLLKDSRLETEHSKQMKRAEKLAAFYWPLLIAIYLGWSLWTMEWGTTWIVWPVGAVFFAALVGLMELLKKEDV